MLNSFFKTNTSFSQTAQTPPGALALDAMVYFASYHPEKYSKVVLENSGRSDDTYDCPFARAAIELIKLLCEILKVYKLKKKLIMAPKSGILIRF